jgi:hypothetical protein
VDPSAERRLAELPAAHGRIDEAIAVPRERADGGDQFHRLGSG